MADQKMERTMAGKKGASNGGKGGGGEEAEAGKKGGGKKMLLVGLLGGVLLLGGGAGGVWYFTKPAAAAPPPVAGAVIALDPISLNLADQHYLKLGIALQATTLVGKETPDGSKALDLAIQEFSGVSMADLSDDGKREHYKDELQEKIVKAYEEEEQEHVMGIYFTQFVMQ